MRSFVLGSLWVAPAALAGPVFTHQGRLLTSAGQPVEGATDLVIRLYDESADTAALWTKTFTGLPVAGGYYAVRLELSDSNAPIDPLALTDGSTWIGVTVGGVEAPRERLASAPAAAVASSVALPHTTSGGTCEVAGSLAYDATAKALLLCDGSTWGGVGSSTVRLTLVSGSRRWSNGTFARSCEEYRRPTGGQSYSGDVGDGVYRVQPSGFAAFDVYCDMTTDTGGWTLISNYVYNVSSQYAFSERTSSAPLLGSVDSYDVNEVGSSTWGTVSKNIMIALQPTEMRFYCRAPTTTRVVHFKTSRIADFISNTSNWGTVGSNYTALAGHTGAGPGSVSTLYNLSGRTNPLNDSLWGGAGQSHWILGTDTYCDTGNASGWGGAATKGLFRVWAR
jgi:hypothetical protein